MAPIHPSVEGLNTRTSSAIPTPATTLLITAIMLAVVPRKANIGPSRNAGDWISGHRPYSGANALCVPRQKSFHDRDCIFAKSLDESIERLGLLVLKSPPRSPMANAICERAIGTIRRECLDWLIPISEAHLRAIVRDWKTHYNGWRPHMALGPGVPDPPAQAVRFQARKSRHRIREGLVVLAKSVLRGLHHEYSAALGSHDRVFT
jgi:Integrase core domain